MVLNPLKWARPLQVIAVLAVALVLFNVLAGGIGTAWARHIANKALSGIARTLSDYDQVEGKAAGLEQAVNALAEENKKLAAEADKERAARREMAVRLAEVQKSNTALLDAVKIAKAKEANRKPIATLDEAVAVFNRIGK